MMPHITLTGVKNYFVQDTAGSERYESMSRIYYRGAKAAIVCYGEKCIVYGNGFVEGGGCEV